MRIDDELVEAFCADWVGPLWQTWTDAMKAALRAQVRRTLSAALTEPRALRMAEQVLGKHAQVIPHGKVWQASVTAGNLANRLEQEAANE